MNLTDWLSKNAWAIGIVIVTMTANYAVTQYKWEVLQDQVRANTNAIIILQNNNTQMQVSLARIETDLAYIKSAVSKLVQY